METKPLDIKEKQKLGDILEFIPTDAIINKKIPGLGATYLELDCKRCSLLIEPNKPVIKEKVKQFKAKGKDVLGVYSGITDERIIKYITSSNPYKKIITTPESYLLRIKPLMDLNSINLFTDYFMLYDESERTIQDIDYRETITAPIDDFFQFVNKAMITATPIQPSDPRFEKNRFYNLEINPLYDYSNQLNLHTTNNVLLRVRDHIKANPSDHYCFFFNSTDGIHSLIKYLKIEDESQIFCSDKSVKKLTKKLGFKDSFTDLKELKKYNFFTSSFFSAVDIELTFKPDVVILSDLFFAEHSMIDPATESVQIMGRFRQGFNSITHITNINTDIRFQSREEISRFLDGCEECYSTLRTLHDSAQGIGQKQTLKEALELVSYSKYVNKDGDKDWFKIDNRLDEDMVKSYYSSTENLINAYSAVDHFKVELTTSKYPLSDQHRLKRTRPKDDIELFKSVVEQMELLKFNREQFRIDNTIELQNELVEEHPELCTYYQELGKERIEQKDYKLSAVKKELKRKITSEKNQSFPAINELLRNYNSRIARDTPTAEILKFLTYLKAKHNLKQGKSVFLRSVYDVSPRVQKTINKQRVWTVQLTNPKFSLPD